jgi:hypothetical protein
MFEYHFRSGSESDVLVELGSFRNDDGGFGHGVEPDLRMPLSSPFASTLAFQVLRELGVPGGQSIVRDGLKYFEQTYDRSIGGWDPVGPDADKFPHAPWWNYKPVDGQLSFLKQSNPGAEILGYLHLYVDRVFVEEAAATILKAFAALPDDMEFHARMCFSRLAEMATDPVAQELLPKLRRGVRQVTGKNPDDWQNYGPRPLWFAPTPGSPLSNELRDSIQTQLDYEIKTQGEDGGWHPNWTWGPGQYETAWETARVEWAGYLTLRNLLTLKAWGRI